MWTSRFKLKDSPCRTRFFGIRCVSILIITSLTTCLVAPSKDNLSTKVTEIDVKPGDNVRLSCRFTTSNISNKSTTLIWLRRLSSGLTRNVAIGATAYQENYSLSYHPGEGIYDLNIKSASYERDNGLFDCKIMEVGSGKVSHTNSIQLTILSPPGKPIVSYQSNTSPVVIKSDTTIEKVDSRNSEVSSVVKLVENDVVNFTCASTGGSPPPEIKWFLVSRPNSDDNTLNHDDLELLPATLIEGKDRSEGSKSILSLNPVTFDHDLSVIRCSVWNRAITSTSEHHLDESSQFVVDRELHVAYYPRITLEATRKSASGDMKLTIDEKTKTVKIEEHESIHMICGVDSKPDVETVKWSFVENSFSKFSNDFQERFIGTDFGYAITDLKHDTDAGIYKCSADNGLPKLESISLEKTKSVGSDFIKLDILYAPRVKVTPDVRIADEGDSVEIECQIDANPRATSIKWFYMGHDRSEFGDSTPPKFIQSGILLKLKSVSYSNSGAYVCSASNEIFNEKQMKNETAKLFENKESKTLTGNATVTLEVRHKPGAASIIIPTDVNNGVAVQGKRYVMRCTSDPPGLPRPTYKWWKDSSSKVLNVGPELILDPVDVHTDMGTYSCQAENEFGSGSKASTNINEVDYEPEIVKALKSEVRGKSGQQGFSIECQASGKPEPNVEWFKDDLVISPSSDLYKISSERVVGNRIGGVTSVKSVLKFVGSSRLGGDFNHLMATDKAIYTCRFSNQINVADSKMRLFISHSPLVIHKHNRVAFDFGEDATLSCSMQADPKPNFNWNFGQKSILLLQQENNLRLTTSSSKVHRGVVGGSYPSVGGLQTFKYETNVSRNEEIGDVYIASLTIRNVEEKDYGDYYCRSVNDFGSKRSKIRLQAKSKPDSPSNLRVIDSGPEYVEIAFDEGFNGGYDTTMYASQAYKIPSITKTQNNNKDSPLSFDCGYSNTCNLTDLTPCTSYRVQVQANNIRGGSKYSTNALLVSTKFDVNSRILKSSKLIDFREKEEKLIFDENAVFEDWEGCLKNSDFSKYSKEALLIQVEHEKMDGSWSHIQDVNLLFENERNENQELKINETVNLRMRLCLTSSFQGMKGGVAFTDNSVGSRFIPAEENGSSRKNQKQQTIFECSEYVTLPELREAKKQLRTKLSNSADDPLANTSSDENIGKSALVGNVGPILVGVVSGVCLLILVFSACLIVKCCFRNEEVKELREGEKGKGCSGIVNKGVDAKFQMNTSMGGTLKKMKMSQSNSVGATLMSGQAEHDMKRLSSDESSDMIFDDRDVLDKFNVNHVKPIPGVIDGQIYPISENSSSAEHHNENIYGSYGGQYNAMQAFSQNNIYGTTHHHHMNQGQGLHNGQAMEPSGQISNPGQGSLNSQDSLWNVNATNNQQSYLNAQFNNADELLPEHQRAIGEYNMRQQQHNNQFVNDMHSQQNHQTIANPNGIHPYNLYGRDGTPDLPAGPVMEGTGGDHTGDDLHYPYPEEYMNSRVHSSRIPTANHQNDTDDNNIYCNNNNQYFPNTSHYKMFNDVNGHETGHVHHSEMLNHHTPNNNNQEIYSNNQQTGSTSAASRRVIREIIV